MEERHTIAAFDIRSYFKRWPRFYFFVGNVFGPMLFCGLSAKEFLKRYPREGQVLNLGSGPRIFPDASIVNVDIHPYDGVNIVTDIASVPILRIGRLLSDSVSQLNIFTIIFDLLLEAPFKTVIRIIEEWTTYLREQRDQIV